MAVTVWVCAAVAQVDTVRWHGIVRDAKGSPLPAAEIELLHRDQPARVRTAADGQFEFTGLEPGEYSVRVGQGPSATVRIAAGAAKTESIRVAADGILTFESPADAAPEATGGEQLSGKQVSALPLNKRDFSQLLLLAAGTQTDANGAANFTQQLPSTASAARPRCLPWMAPTPPTRRWAARPSRISTSMPSRRSGRTPESCRRDRARCGGLHGSRQ